MLKFKLHTTDALVPTKAGPEESGYDLTAISFVKKRGKNTFMYDTGVSVEVPPGYYTEIVPRSSISKTGFVLSNSIGVIDATYRGTLKIVLTDVDSEAKNKGISRPLTCPFTLAQLIVRKRHDLQVEVVNELSETTRGDGGFGSTGAAGGNTKRS